MRSQRRHPADELSASTASVERRSVRDLEDDFLASYVRWREACADVHLAYEYWRGVARGHAADAFVVFQAALDQEECAAHEYCDLAGRLTAGAPRNW